MASKFVVLSTARSGSSLLIETLHKHPEIYCHGEIFHERTDWHLRPEFRSKFDLSRRESDPLGFARALLEFTAGRRVVGFKMWIDQNEQVCSALLADASVKKIILERDNKLAQYSSGQLAKKSGVWNIGADASRAALDKHKKRFNGKAAFSRKAFLKFLRYQDDVFNTYRQKSVGDHIELTYADIARNDLDGILSFLGVTNVPLQPAKQRLYSSDIIGRFDDQFHDEIREMLRELAREEWESEEVT
jgi:LPS sulfotransferase NodH